MRSSIETMKSPRIVEIFNSDGTISTYPSIYSAVISMGFKKGNTNNVYRYVARGGGRLIDVKIPVEVINEHGLKTKFQDHHYHHHHNLY